MGVQHYEQGVETMDFIQAVLSELGITATEGFIVGNALKYARRAGLKDGADWHKDAVKCADYLNRWKTGEWL